MKNQNLKICKATVAFILITGMIACGKQSDVTAPKTIESSFSTVPVSAKADLNLHSDLQHIQLQTSALEKEFLLQVSLIAQPTAAMGSGLKSRVVAFRKRGDKVYLLEATQGHSVTNDLPQNLVIAEMQIISENENGIVIDFNKGMSQLMVASEWRASDTGEKEYDAEATFVSVPLRYSYIESASFESNHLEIRQIAQAVSKEGVAAPVEVKYYLSPYQPNKEFQPSQNQGNFEKFGFFEAAPLQRNNENDIINATKFNKLNPIVYAVSENTPADYKQAVKDGVLYWNQAFGYEAIKVIDAPRGVVAPSINYNVIQWVKYDNAGFAYADAQVDPRTGETLHAQVYFTSAFAISGKRSARTAIRQWESQQSSKQSKNLQRMSLKGFTTESLCNFSLSENFINNLRTLLSNNVDDAKILKASQDYVRDVSAHEVGHTLGLRHNFAGSLAATYKVSERSSINKTYYETGSTPKDLISSSSVMEYQLFEESTWTGDLIAKKKGSLPYDLMAIQTLYLIKNFNDSESPLFCTDSHAEKFGDCKRFDTGHSYMEALTMKEETSLRSMAINLLYKFVSAKAPPIGDSAISLTKVSLPDPKSFVMALNAKAAGSMIALTPTFKLLSIHRSFPVVDFANIELVKNTQLDYLQSEINSLGGFSELLKGDGSLKINQAREVFQKILAENRSGLGFGDQAYEFSDEEMQLISNRVDSFLKVLSIEVVKFHSNLLNGNMLIEDKIESLGAFPDHQMTDEVAKVLLENASKLILTETDEKTVVEISVPVTPASDDKEKATKQITVALPSYKYSYEVRKNAANFLRGDRSESVVFGLLQRKSLSENLKKATKNILSVDLVTIKAEDMPSMKAARWVKENQNILEEIK